MAVPHQLLRTAPNQTADVSSASRVELSLRAIMEIRSRGANRCSTTSRAKRVIGVSPRRSDRCAIIQISVQSSWGDELFAVFAATVGR